MTQAIQPAISLTVTPTEPHAPWEVMPVGQQKSRQLQSANGNLAVSAEHLVLLPGMPGDIQLRTKNNGTQSLRLRLEIEGDFPAAWFADERWVSVDPQTDRNSQRRWSLPLDPLDANSERYETATFQVDDRFFEHADALAQIPNLDLEYQGRCNLYAAKAEGQGGERLVGCQPIHLFVRPSANYLACLPDIYQSDFLGRFLTIFEQAFDPTMQTMDLLWAYLDPLTAPAALLPFLSEWVAWPMNPQWTLKQQRWLIRHAVEIYRWRGTRRGLQFALSLVTGLPREDRYIDIVESDQKELILGDVNFEDVPILGGGKAFHFSVTLRPDTLEQRNQFDEETVRSVIEQEKSAFCTYDLIVEVGESSLQESALPS